ncbi:MAG: Rrf2 family transcriptional regulator [Polyangia bacterium]|jgi:Rrf2 family protein
MMRIARQTDYAARLVLHLASLGEEASASIAEIAQQRLLPVPFVRRMVAPLVAAGILKTTRGAKGGLQLGRPASAISLGDLVLAMEGPIALNDCVHQPGACPFRDHCPVQQAWLGLSAALAEQLAAIRFDRLVGSAADAHAAAHAAMRKDGARRSSKGRARARSHP